jgi:hypothetical protein
LLRKHVTLAARLGVAPVQLNTVVKNMDILKCCALGSRFSDQGKNLKHAPFQELESLLGVWFKQARPSNIVISGILLREKALHITTRLGSGDIKSCNGWTDGFKQWSKQYVETLHSDYTSQLMNMILFPDVSRVEYNMHNTIQINKACNNFRVQLLPDFGIIKMLVQRRTNSVFFFFSHCCRETSGSSFEWSDRQKCSDPEELCCWYWPFG